MKSFFFLRISCLVYKVIDVQIYEYNKIGPSISKLKPLKLNQTLDYRKQLVNTPIIVFQHRSFADAYIINYINGPTSFVYRDILNSNIFVKYFIEKLEKL